MNRLRTDVLPPATDLPSRQKTVGIPALELVPGADPYIAELVRQYHWALSQEAAAQGGQALSPAWFPPVRKPH